MVALPAAARALIESNALAHLTTLNRDGSPQVTGVWVGLDGDEIVVGTLARRQKVINCERDPRVALSIQSTRHNAFGLLEYLVVYGRARVQEGGAAPLLRRLAKLYMGPDAVFPPGPNPPAGYVLRITPDRLAGVGPWG
jgi:PPOX class probable F420-dependent enzyme